MAAQKYEKYCQKIFFLHFWMRITPKPIKSNSLNSFRPYRRLLENQKTGGSRELFLPENDFQTRSTKYFLKKPSDFGGLETNRRHEIQTWIFFHKIFFLFYILTHYHKNCFGHLARSSSKCHKFWGQNKRKSARKAKKTNFTIFWALYFWKY